jgi:hypothetical protein
MEEYFSNIQQLQNTIKSPEKIFSLFNLLKAVKEPRVYFKIIDLIGGLLVSSNIISPEIMGEADGLKIAN